MLPSLREGQLRLSRHYLDRLGELTMAYEHSTERASEALVHFDQDWGQIEPCMRWLADAGDAETAQLFMDCMLAGAGIVYRNIVRGQYEDFLTIARKTAHATADLEVEHFALRSMADLAEDEGRYLPANQLREDACAVARRMGHPFARCDNLVDTAVRMIDRQGGDEGVHKLLGQALEIAGTLGDPHRKMRVMSLMGRTLAEVGYAAQKTDGTLEKFEEGALEFLDDALRIARDLGDRKNEGVLVGNLGVALSLQNEHAKAQEFCQKSLELSIDFHDYVGEAVNHRNLSTLYREAGQPKLEANHANASVEICRLYRLESSLRQGVFYHDYVWRNVRIPWLDPAARRRGSSIRRMTIELPERDAVLSLPRFAATAVAARGARRVAGIHALLNYMPDGDAGSAAIEEAIRFAENFACGESIRLSATNDAAAQAYAAGDRSLAGWAAYSAAAAAGSAGSEKRHKQHAYDAVVYAFHAAAYASSPKVTESVRELLQHDLQLARDNAERKGWTHGTHVPPSFFGALWPDGEPDWWPAEEVVGTERESCHRKLIVVEERFFDLHGLARDYSMLGQIYRERGDIDGTTTMYCKAAGAEQQLGRLGRAANHYGLLGSTLTEFALAGGDLSHLSKAEEMTRMAISIESELGRPEMANAHKTLLQLIERLRSLQNGIGGLDFKQLSRLMKGLD